MNKIDIFKAIAGFVSGAGVSVIVNNAIKSTTPENVSKLSKIGIFIGGMALSSFVSDKVESYISEQIDNTIESIKNFAQKLPTNKEMILIPEDSSSEESKEN